MIYREFQTKMQENIYILSRISHTQELKTITNIKKYLIEDIFMSFKIHILV